MSWVATVPAALTAGILTSSRHLGYDIVAFPLYSRKAVRQKVVSKTFMKLFVKKHLKFLKLARILCRMENVGRNEVDREREDHACSDAMEVAAGTPPNCLLVARG